MTPISGLMLSIPPRVAYVEDDLLAVVAALLFLALGCGRDQSGQYQGKDEHPCQRLAKLAHASPPRPLSGSPEWRLSQGFT